MSARFEIWRRIASALARATRRMCAFRYKTRYARALETELQRLQSECVRLRQENRALLNSILGIAGIPPIDVSPLPSSSVEDPRSQPASPSGPGAPAPGPASPAYAAGSSLGTVQPSKPGQVSAPLRRRSWHQIHRALEFEAARKKPGAEAQKLLLTGPKV